MIKSCLKSSTTFKKFPEYTFDDPTRKFESEEITVFDGKIDSEGNASVYTNLRISDEAPGMLKANFLARVFEESGDFSIDRF